MNKLLSPCHEPKPIVVFLVHDSKSPQVPNKHPSPLGSQPRRASARELLPDPVGPTITIRGKGYDGSTFWSRMGEIVENSRAITMLMSEY